MNLKKWYRSHGISEEKEHVTKEEITSAIKDDAWQKLRVSLKGKSTEEKMRELSSWANGHKTRKGQVQVINYINALKRGGLL